LIESIIVTYRKDLKSLLLLVGVFILARVLFILFMPYTFSSDVYGWMKVIEVLKEGKNPYKETQYLNWPPLWMQILFGVSKLSEFLHISPVRILQSILIIIEGIVMLLSYGILRQFFDYQKITKALLISMAINPISILLTCQHCNFDILVAFWLLLFTWMLLDFNTNNSSVSWLMACFFLGMGILTKTIPIILSPLLLAGTRKQKKTTNLFGIILLLAPVTIGMSVLFTLERNGVIQNVLSYRSSAGWFGITGILNFLGEPKLNSLYRAISPLFFLGLLLYMAWRIFKIRVLNPTQIISIILLLLLFVPTFGPGYAPQYINWFLPFMIMLFVVSTNSAKKILKAGYCMVAITYLIEYAFFTSHGAFITKMFPTEQILSLSTLLSTQKMQVIIRLPLFIFYSFLCIYLIKSIKLSEAPINIKE
jgi:hypothetical protein